VGNAKPGGTYSGKSCAYKDIAPHRTLAETYFYFFPIILDGYYCKRKRGWGVLFLETMIPFAELANVPYIH
jgi:hypothetical protein